MTGRIPESHLRELLAKRWKINPNFVDFIRRSATSAQRLNRDVVAFFEGLRPRYKTAILSNAGDDTGRAFRKFFRFDELADLVVISAEEGLAKPGEEIFYLTLERLGVQPEEAIFLDDLLENIETAAKIGLHAIQFFNPLQAICDVQAVLSEDETGEAEIEPGIAPA
jgi:epoxide hydrolase-like predicted phosphatase